MNYIPSEVIAEESKKIIENGDKKGIVLRLMGACAVEAHCPKFKHWWRNELKRELTDIDIATYGKFRSQVKDLLDELGYKPKKMLMMDETYRWRDIYIKEDTGLVVDVFYDKLDMCHTINFAGRLEIDYPTIPLAELLLEKGQIVKITEKDIKDIIVLIKEHEIGEDDRDKINVNYISKVLSKDWGFYYTLTTNLNKVRKLLRSYSSREDNIIDVDDKIAKLLDRIEKEPKSLQWKLRAKLGTTIKWYREV
ncbi:MAG: hypothetical protein QXY75_06680 [Candidatus Bathyarchaeia archaeon]